MQNDAHSTLDRATHSQSVYLSLGSNLGDREANLRDAAERIKALGLEIARASSIYETEPVGYKDQPWFLNQVIEVRVDFEVIVGDGEKAELINDAYNEGDLELALSLWVYELHQTLQGIEREMGRRRTIPSGPRVIDIDVLLCGKMEGFWAESRGNNLAEAGPVYLTLPHPRMHKRRFVLVPLCEIAPDLVHPTLKKTCRDMLDDVGDPSAVTRYEKGAG